MNLEQKSSSEEEEEEDETEKDQKSNIKKIISVKNTIKEIREIL